MTFECHGMGLSVQVTAKRALLDRPMTPASSVSAAGAGGRALPQWPVELAAPAAGAGYSDKAKKVDDLFSGIDFTSGTTEKATLLNAGSVVSFQTVNGVKGLAKFSAVGADATGSTKVTLIIQN